MKTSVNGRIRRNSAEWEALLSRFEASGRGGDEFCRTEGLCRSTFHKWRRKLRPQGSSPQPTQDFIEMTPATDRIGGWTVEIELPDGIVARVRG
jgi:hypothetical protein